MMIISPRLEPINAWWSFPNRFKIAGQNLSLGSLTLTGEIPHGVLLGKSPSAKTPWFAKLDHLWLWFWFFCAFLVQTRIQLFPDMVLSEKNHHANKFQTHPEIAYSWLAEFTLSHQAYLISQHLFYVVSHHRYPHYCWFAIHWQTHTHAYICICIL